MRPIVLVDTESTGLDPELHEMWEFGAIEYSAGGRPEHQYIVPPRNLAGGDGQGVAVGGFYERTAGLGAGNHGECFNLAGAQEQRWSDPGAAALAIARLLSRSTVMCAVPTHDVPFLKAFLRANGHIGAWHFRVRDFGSVARGYLLGRASALGPEAVLPGMDASTDVFAEALGVDPGQFGRHEALGDCRLLAACLDVMTGTA